MNRPAILGGDRAFPNGLTLTRPAVPAFDRVVSRLQPSYDAGMLTNGALVRALEEQTAELLDVRHAVAVSSCTSGLILTLHALGTEGVVVMPSFTFSATAHVAVWNRLVPRFAECQPDSYQVDVSDATARLENASVLLATHIFGAPCPVDELEKAAADAGVPLVIDAAHALGARRRGRRVGGFGRAEVFSLSPTKPVVAGEGGIVATDDDALAEHVRLGRDYGNPGDYDTRFAGLNARMSELHAAVALESLVDLEENLSLRRAVADRYRSALAGVPGVTPQHVDPADESTFKDFTISIDEERFGLSRDMVVGALGAEGVDTRCYFYPPVHQHVAYEWLDTPPLPVTDAVAGRVISLPMFPALANQQVDTVAESIEALHGQADAVRQEMSAQARAATDPQVGGTLTTF